MHSPIRRRPARPTTAAIRGAAGRSSAAADWDGFAGRRVEAKARGKLRGIGCAAFIEPSGGLGQEEIAINFDGQRPAATLHAGRALRAGPRDGVSRSRRRHPRHGARQDHAAGDSDPDGPPLVGTGSFGSRSLICHGGALSVGAHEVVRKGWRSPRRSSKSRPPISCSSKGRYRVPGTDLSISLDELARKHAGGETHPLDAIAKIAHVMRPFPAAPMSPRSRSIPKPA